MTKDIPAVQLLFAVSNFLVFLFVVHTLNEGERIWFGGSVGRMVLFFPATAVLWQGIVLVRLALGDSASHQDEKDDLS